MAAAESILTRELGSLSLHGRLGDLEERAWGKSCPDALLGTNPAEVTYWVPMV